MQAEGAATASADTMDPKTTKVMLISANVGSIFEDPEHMLKIWLQEFLKTISNIEPGIFALHLQEVGGKNYEASMQHVNHFIKSLLGSEHLQRYDRARVFLDEDFTAVDKFTALGNIYFIHESVEKAEIWNFQEFRFVPVEGKEVLSGNIENVATKEKAKFPQHFFPEFKWSRKGFLRTRWNINNSVYDLVNIHLFHDASNLVAMQSSPSLYCGNRQQALMHTLQRFENDKYEKVPLFIFGDFNFRLDIRYLVEELTHNAKVNLQKGNNRIVYTDEENNGKVLLTIETKAFDHHEKHSEVFGSYGKWLHKFDKEVQAFKDKLHEYDICFQPSYPFSEDLNDGMSYMKTRCPSWCDRVLLSPGAKQLMLDDEKHKPNYDLIGKSICMGDHKPVCLYFHLRNGQGNSPVVVHRSSRSQTVSINGEEVDDVLLDNVSIHDFAMFEHQHLLPLDFLNSIKHKCLNSSADSESSTSDIVGQNSSSLKKKKSFLECAQKVKKYEEVLLKWPKRTRHHSSSSEESVAEETSVDMPVTEKGMVAMETDTPTDSINTPLTSSISTDSPHSPAQESGGKEQRSSIISKTVTPAILHAEFQPQHKAVSPVDPQHAFISKSVPLSDVVKLPRKQRSCCCCCIL